MLELAGGCRRLGCGRLPARHEPETRLRYNGTLIHGRRVAPPPARATDCEEHMSDETKSTERAIISVLGADRSGIVAAAAVAIVLNIVLPKDKEMPQSDADV